MAEASGSHVTPIEVAEQCVDHYYKMLRNQPHLAHQCFRDGSVMLRVHKNTNEAANTMQQIQELIATFNDKRIERSIQSSFEYRDEVQVMVWGALHIKDCIGPKMFQEIFILSPQEQTFYIRSDFFQYFDEDPTAEQLVALVHRHFDLGSSASNAAEREAGQVALEEVASTSTSTSRGKEPLLDEEVLASDDVAPADNSFENKMLYVGNFPYSYDKAKVTGIIQEFATPELVEVPKRRGYAHVIMSSIEDCNTVIEELNRKVCDGRALKVHFKGKPKPEEPQPPETQNEPQPDRKWPLLIVGNLYWTVTSENLRREFRKYGRIVRASVSYDPETKVSRGRGFVIYETRAEMDAALAALNGVVLKGRPMQIRSIN